MIVESPAKAQTIKNYLGAGYQVVPSIGHVRDLAGPADVPERLKKKGTYSKFSVDVHDNFKPYYEVPADKKKTVTSLRTALKEADELYLATDEDREGEAIAWHLLEVLKPKVPVKRMVFHEITREAIERALENTRDINRNLVDAQETRRILDRLFGYEISPILWRKVGRSLSAGRVQSVATRLIVDREKERMAFTAATYWSVEASLQKLIEGADGQLGQGTDANGTGVSDNFGSDNGTAASVTTGQGTTRRPNRPFTARVVLVDDQPVAVGADFDDSGELTAKAQQANTLVLTETSANAVAKALESAHLRVHSLTRKPYRSRPAAPFVTSSLQQEASRKLKWNAQTTMRMAQRLYESGYITYMRTDSPGLSQQAIQASREAVKELFGADQLPDSPRIYTKAAKGAQEAHEAIRPAGEHFRSPESLRSVLSPQEWALYELIWKRTLASQMIDATGYTATVRIQADAEIAGIEGVGETAGTASQIVLSTSGTVITSAGFRQLYQEGTDQASTPSEAKKAASKKANPDSGAATGESKKDSNELPDVAEGEVLATESATANEHQTRPPARYTEASLVRAMEQKGIGRPSTYASTIQTITSRGYVTHRGQYLIPTWLAFAVTRLLVENFAGFVDYDFTAKMEEGLDEIAAGQEKGAEYLHNFYFGIDKDSSGSSTIQSDDSNSEPPLAHSSANGSGQPIYSHSGENADEGLLAAVSHLGEIDAREINSVRISPTIVLRIGRYGPYLEDDQGNHASVPPDVAPDELNQEKAQEIFVAASVDGRLLGVDPDTGHQIQVRIGRYGPYVTEVLEAESDSATGEGTPKTGKAASRRKKADAPKPRTASLFKDMQPKTVTLSEALQLLTLPRTLGTDPATGEEITAQNGPYGPYLKKGSDSRNLGDERRLLTITLEEALEIYSQPKQRARSAKPPLREFGEDPVSQKKVVVKDGRFGPYITDGKTNVTVPRAETVEGLTEERAFTLLAEKRAKTAEDEPKRKTPAAKRQNSRKSTTQKSTKVAK